MKKSIVFIGLLGWICLMPAFGGAAEADGLEVTDKTLAALEPKKSSSAEEFQKADKDAFNEEDLVVTEKRPVAVPMATVSGDDKKEALASKTKAKSVVVKPSAPPVKVSAVKKASLVKSKTAVVSGPSAGEMEKNWKALFSKDLTKDSILYTVKSGDSLYVLAKKNHTTIDLIKKLNGLKSDNLYPKMKLKIHTAPFSIVVDKSKNTLTLYSNNVPVKKYSVATGKKNCTPVGSFKIADKLMNPTWFKTGAILPPGSPENGLGTRWMGFDKPSYGIHGTIDPKSIGTQASEGCVRMLNEEVEELYGIVPTGTTVTIQD